MFDDEDFFIRLLTISSKRRNQRPHHSHTAPSSTSPFSSISPCSLGKEGLAAKTPTTVFATFEKTVSELGDKKALFQKRPKTGQKAADVEWTSWTWSEYKKEAFDFAKSLISLGFEPFDTINIIGFNAPEWFFSNFGAIAAGGVAAGIYTTNLSEACHYISSHSKAKVVVCEGLKQLEKYLTMKNKLPNLKALVVYGLWDDGATIPEEMKKKSPVPVYTYDEFRKLGEAIAEEKVQERIDAALPGHVCTLIYTSGTTGPPKAVMITHDNITWTVNPILLASRRGSFTNNDVAISYLPLVSVVDVGGQNDYFRFLRSNRLSFISCVVESHCGSNVGSSRTHGHRSPTLLCPA